MSEVNDCAEHSHELSFEGKPIRVLLFDGTPWFALPDCCDALGFGPAALEAVNHRAFPDFARHYGDELPDPYIPGEPERVVMLSPIGVFHWSALVHPTRGQRLSAWAKREALKANPTAARDNRHVYLTLVDGALPARPEKYSGRRGEWYELRDSDAYRMGPNGWPSYAAIASNRAVSQRSVALAS